MVQFPHDSKRIAAPLKRFSSITCLLAAAHFSHAAEKISYAREILPILSENCFHCHGPDKKHREEDLRLDIRAEAIKAFEINSVQGFLFCLHRGEGDQEYE